MWFDPSLRAFLEPYAGLLVFFLSILAVGLLLIGFPFLIRKIRSRSPGDQPCARGFPPPDAPKGPLGSPFHKIAALFVFFEVGVVFLLPWAVCLKKNGGSGLGCALFFLAMLTIGFFYQWKAGTLEWE